MIVSLKRDARRDREIGAAALEEREHIVEAARESIEDREPVVVVPAMVDVPKSERVVKEKQKPLFQDMPIRRCRRWRFSRMRRPMSRSARRHSTTSRLIERKLADFGVSVKVLAAYRAR